MTTTQPREVNQLESVLREYALGFPGAHEDFPWGERALKVNKRVFVFMGYSTEGFGISVKLPQSLEDALALPDTEPTHYGLGKHGWVTVRLDSKARISTEMLRQWIEESYRAVAPARFVTQLDTKPQPAKKASRKK